MKPASVNRRARRLPGRNGTRAFTSLVQGAQRMSIPGKDALGRPRRESADQLAQAISLSAPSVPIIVEFPADHLANLEQPVDLQGSFSSCQLRSVTLHRHFAFYRHGGGTCLARSRGKYLVKLSGVDLVVAGVGPGH